MKPVFFFINFIMLNNRLHSQEDNVKKSNRFTLHIQETTVSQYRPKFSAAYTGPHSQIPENEWGTTITSTIFAGVKLWNNVQFFVNPKIAGGHGLSSAFGIAAFTNGEAFRVGNPDHVFYVARAYFRQLIPLSKEKEWQSDNENKIQQYIQKNILLLL